MASDFIDKTDELKPVMLANHETWINIERTFQFTYFPVGIDILE